MPFEPTSDTPSAVHIHDARQAAFLSDIIETQSDLAAVELDPQLILRMVAQRTQKLALADGAAVELVDADDLVCRAGSGIMESYIGRRLSLAGSLAGHAIRTGQFQTSPDLLNDPRADVALATEIGLRSIVIVPLFNQARPIGVIVVVSRRTDAFERRIVSALRLMAGLVAASLIHAEEFAIKKKLLAERTEALSALRQSEQCFHSAFEHAAIGMALVGLDGRWLQVNGALCRIVGYTESELLVRDFQSITYPDDLNVDLAFIGRLIAGDISDYQMVKRYFHRDGHLVWVLLSVSLVRDDQGKPLHFISQIQDITQRQRVEQALRASEEEYRATFELDGVGKVQLDMATGRFIRVNQKFCEIVGYSADELCCMTFAQISAPQDLESSMAGVRRMLRGDVTHHTMEKRYIRKDGRVIWVSLSATVIKDSASRASRSVATILDITERKQSEWLEQDRRRVLEMVARGMPLPEVLGQLAEAIERQIEGSTAAIMVLHDGNIDLHAANLTDPMRKLMEQKRLTLAGRLAEGLCGGDQRYGVTHLCSDAAWNDFRPAALNAGLKTCWTAAIDASDGTTLGLLLVFCPHVNRPTQANLQTLEMAGKLATIVIEHNHSTRQLAHLVRHDRLTGLPNRLMYEDRVQQALAVAGRTGKYVGLMVLDIDKFKNVNDSLGHHAGDHLLQQFALRLRTQLRDSDTMARIGGDEFIVVLPEMDNREAPAIVAKKLISALAQPFQLPDQQFAATCSIGIAVYPTDGEDVISLQKKADAALYRVKAMGRNGFSY